MSAELRDSGTVTRNPSSGWSPPPDPAPRALYTEDLNHGQNVLGVQIVNPFRTP